MQINIDGRSVTRVLAVAAATIGVGAAAFFGGQTTRMDDTAIAGVKHNAVESAVEKVERTHAAELAIFRREAKDDKARAIRKTRRVTRKNERKRAARLADKARNEGYSSGNTAGYGAGHSAGKEEGEVEGYSDGYDDAVEFSEPCSDDPEVTSLPYC